MSFRCRVCKKSCDVASTVLPDVCVPCFSATKRAAEEIHRPREKEKDEQAGERYGAGEYVAQITKKLGIAECKPCGRRRAAMNTINLSGPAYEVFKGLTEAIIHPEKVLEDATENDSAKGNGTKSGNR